MGLEHNWVQTGSTIFQQQGHPNGGGGEGDSTGTPASQPVNSWPTLVIEAGAPREDMEWWFEASNYQVKMVLLAKLDRPGRRILLERWVAQLKTSDKVRHNPRGYLHASSCTSDYNHMGS
ncbi:hypothetical protein B0T25DRAFT_302125 [Lasiosphaeria hispida]|uniref:Uncharacterized protein n=1 Tax=Lasiosphaeria hispida TaxID=260671 RepID=A0AAJ0M934_9PEZI|nr:hypothetical protein B0T25DRAFT_302125 [Lasiosphaeria hispida]